tara:strand:+ start:1059 stop:1559 length:501 start_codon:yes stop_codon:yes gene_type:complete
MDFFPSLSPSVRVYSVGDVPVARQMALSGATTNFRRGSRLVNQNLQLTFSHLTETNMNLITAHYLAAKGTYDFFFGTNALWGDYSGAEPVPVLGNTAWRYASPPSIADVSYDRFTVEVELISHSVEQGDFNLDGGGADGSAAVYIADALTASATPARQYIFNGGDS